MRIHIALFLFLCCACNVSQKISQPVQQNDSSQTLIENTTHLQAPALMPFYHGVASGDPLQDGFVIWTRVTPKSKMETIPVTWEVAEDQSFIKIIKSGKTNTSPVRDYTVKTIVEGLQANTSYYYRFKSLDKYSTIGTSRTLPTGEEAVNLAFVSCSNIEFGYFNAYAAIAEDDVDVVIHLGDYIYEYGPDEYGDKKFDRKNIPPHEIISLQDYRDRYSQYRLDEDLQKVHSKHPFINIWDDHEITNNAYVSGAQNHQNDEGDYDTRKDIARQVYYEWLPIREEDTHYRKFKFGNTLELIMLDERLAGRTMQPDSLSDPRRTASDHHLLGETQMQWLIDGLKKSTSTWKIIGNQVIFSYSDWGHDSFRQNMDAWDGYPNDQTTLSNAIKENAIDNIVFVTGDTHTAWAFEATNDPFNAYNKETSAGAIGVEFGVTSITSGNANERYPTPLVKSHEKKICNTQINPHLKYVNMRDHGYLKLSIDKNEMIATYKIVPKLKIRNSKTVVDKEFVVKRGKIKLIEK